MTYKEFMLSIAGIAVKRHDKGVACNEKPDTNIY